MDIWEKAVEFHGHRCGGLALGVRAAMEARLRFGTERAEDEELVCVTENDACGVDGIQSILGCTLGKGNLIYYGTGKMAYSFFNRATGEGFRLLAKDKRQDLHGDEYIEYVLNAPIDDVFYVGRPRIEMPERARSLKSVKCSICGEIAAETMMRVADGRLICIECYNARRMGYDRGWSGLQQESVKR